MANVSYKVAIRDHSGNIIARFSGLGRPQGGGMSGVSYVRRLRDPDTVTLPIFGADPRITEFMLDPSPGDYGGLDYLIEVYRRDLVGGLPFTRDATGLLRADGADQNEEGQLFYVANGTGLNVWHYAEEIAYPSGSSQSSKSGDVATVAAEFVDENIGPNAGNDNDGQSRVRPYLTIVAPTASGVTWRGGRSYKLLSDVVQELASRANAQYKIENHCPEDASGTPDFRWTWKSIYGKDVRPDNTAGNPPVVFSALQGTASRNRVGINRNNDLTSVYALGQGRESSRRRSDVNDLAALAASPWARRAVSRNWSSAYPTAELEAAGFATIEAQKALPDVSFDILQTPAVRYKREWDLGYIVRYIDYFGREFDITVISVGVGLAQDGTETITIGGELYNG